MNKILRIAGLLFLLISSQAQAQTQKEFPQKIKLTASELDAVGSLLFGGKDNKVSGCVDSSFTLLLGLTFLRIGKAEANVVHESLLKSAETDAMKDEKERQYKIWLEKGVPAVASADLQYCLTRNEVDFSFSSLGDTCLGLMQVQTTAFALKGLRSDEKVYELMQTLWATQVKDEYVKMVTGAVLKHKGTDVEKFRALQMLNRALFYECIERENGL